MLCVLLWVCGSRGISADIRSVLEPMPESCLPGGEWFQRDNRTDGLPAKYSPLLRNMQGSPCTQHTGT